MALYLDTSPALCLTQEEITTATLNTFNTASANFEWNTYIDQYLNGVPASGIQQYESGQLAWGQSYVAMAQRAMFDATGDTQYLDLLLDGAETMYANRADRLSPPLTDKVRNKLMPAFISFRYNPGTQYAWLVHSAFPSHPVTYALSTINSDPQLQSAYGTRGDALAADIIETMDSFEPDFRPNGGGCVGCGEYYEPYLDLTSAISDGQTPYNMQNAAGSTYVALWKATGEQRFYDRAVALATTLKEEFTPIGDRYQWRYAPYNPSNSASDISHAGLDVNFVVDAYEAGIVFDDTDIQRLANTMRHMQVDPGFTASVSGAGAGSMSNTRVAWLWLRLARYDAALREEVYPVFQDYWDTATVTEPLFPTLGAALLYETGQHYTPQMVFDEPFDRLQLDPRWRRPLDQPIGDTWEAEMTASQLVVDDIQTASSAQHWVDVLKTRDVQQDDSWEVSYDFSWDSADGAADPLEAMQRFFVELRDSAGELIANVGFTDSWNQHRGGRVIELFDQTIIEPFDSIPLAGSASVRIISDALLGVSNIYWDDLLLLSVSQASELTEVGLNFGHFTGSGVASHFGQIALDSFAVSELVPQLVADFNGDGTVNAADYTVWRDTLGASVVLRTGADATGDGLVAIDDYQRWHDDFGLMAPAGATGGAIPEPVGATLLTGIMAGLLATRRRRAGKFSDSLKKMF